jgi:2-methylcitrate dehydratase PrpD
MSLDFMETYKNLGHPGSGIVMTSLALGEREKVTGRELITSICAAYDVTGRIIDATAPSPALRRKVWNESWHVCGPTFTALRLLGLNEKQGIHALGMGLGNAPTMNVHNILFIPGSMSKAANHVHSFVGINAATLARLGYTGYHEILDDPFGYWTTFSDTNNKELYTKDLGRVYFVNTAMALKPWPTCRWAQPGIESLLEMMSSEGLHSEDVEEVIYRAHEKITDYPYNSIDPKTPEDAYWTVPWAFANAALFYNPGPDWYRDERFRDTALRTFMKKVKISTLPEAVEAFAREPEKSVTELEMKDRTGKRWIRRSEYCKGDPQRPLSHEEVIHKFLRQTEGTLSRDKAYMIVEAVGRVEKLDDVSSLMAIVRE